MLQHTNKIILISICFILNSKNILAQNILGETLEDLIEPAKNIGYETFEAFLSMFISCTGSPITGQQFKIDNIKGFINSPARTTVGTAPRLTNNRKFFANVVATREFKDMLDKDVDAIRGNFVSKMKYCDSVVMNQEMLRDFYDREVDQTKL